MKRNYFNALNAYRISMSQEGQVASGLNNSAIILEALGLEKQALDSYNAAINHFQTTGEANNPVKYYINRSNICMSLGNSESSLADLETAVSINKGLDSINFILYFDENQELIALAKARYYVQEGKLQEALNILSNDGPKEPTDKSNIYQGFIFELLGEYGESENEYIKAMPELSKRLNKLVHQDSTS